MRRPILLLVLALAVPASQAQRAAIAPWITGERLLKRLDSIDPANVPWSPESALPTRQLMAEHFTKVNREFVQGYIEAVHDATEGKSWCFNEKYQVPNPMDVWDHAIWGLRGLAASQIKRNASDLLVEIWREKWPCPPKHRRQE